MEHLSQALAVDDCVAAGDSDSDNSDNAAAAAVADVAAQNAMANTIETLPPEVILHILSYLDIPELDALSCMSRALYALTQDPLLHRRRLRIVAPSRVQHSLFALGGALRPSVPDLVVRGVLRGLGLERRWRMGLYYNSDESVKQYETSQRLQRCHVRHVLSAHLQRESPQAALARVLPERGPEMELRRDTLARMVRDRDRGEGVKTQTADANALLGWFEGRGHGLWEENERVRLAICPGVGKFVRFFEELAK